MVIYLWITKNNAQICNSGLFLQNALVEYIGVYSDTNEQNGLSQVNIVKCPWYDATSVESG